MFLEKGFNDYLSKPIEIAKLDDLIARWVPPKKQIKTVNRIKRESFSGPGLTIPGIDTAKGIVMTGGTLEGYKDVLASFCKDSLTRLPVLQTVLQAEAEDLTDFTAHVHALKSAAGTIGAAELSREAAEMEAAGKAGGTGIIKEKLPGFYEHLKETTGRISAALVEGTHDGENSGPLLTISDAGIRGLFEELKAAVETKNIESIDLITEKLTDKRLDKKTKQTLDAVSDLLLMSKFKQAAEEINTLLKVRETNEK
jgi:HPt (histidine-containing phosphotransfer) domain-containing protein